MDGRNYLRGLLGACGFNAVCFGNEAICFDNLKPIQPKMVMAETDSTAVAWRFIFALHTIGFTIPLIIVSDRLSAAGFETIEYRLPLHVMALDAAKAHISKQGFKVDRSATASRRPLFVGQADAVKEIRSMLPMIAGTRDAVMITGEHGTGKELLIRIIVGLSDGYDRFIKIDCRELLPEMLINGWIQKSFDGEDCGKPTTIFLDHLDQLSGGSQAEMLLVLDTQQKSGGFANAGRVGAVRFICAASQQMEKIVQQEKFRKDLYYRLNVIPLILPALRERREDISPLMDYFILEACVRMGKCITFPSKRAREVCYMHNWPGNIAELQNQMYRVAESGSEACLYANNRIPEIKTDIPGYLSDVAELDDLPKSYEIKGRLPDLSDISLKGICEQFVSRTEKRLMRKALESTNWNRKKAAQLLRISYKTMLNKMKAYDII